jgi:hypothetical protein
MNPDHAHRIVRIAGHQDAVTVLLKTLHQDDYVIVISDNEYSWKPWQFRPLGHRTLFRSMPAAISVGLAQTRSLWDLNCFSLWPFQINCLKTIRLGVRLSFQLHRFGVYGIAVKNVVLDLCHSWCRPGVRVPPGAIDQSLRPARTDWLW